MNFEFTENAWEEFQYWIETDSTVVEKIKDLLNEIKKKTISGKRETRDTKKRYKKLLVKTNYR